MAIPTELPGRWYERWQGICAAFPQCLVRNLKLFLPIQAFNFARKGKMLEKERHCSVQQCVDIASGTLIVYKLVFCSSFETRQPKQALGIEVKSRPNKTAEALFSFPSCNRLNFRVWSANPPLWWLRVGDRTGCLHVPLP